MSQAPKDNFNNWVFFLLGSLLFARGSVELYGYTTGQVFFKHQKSIPLNLVGSDAALMYAAFVVIGALFLAFGIKGLFSK